MAQLTATEPQFETVEPGAYEAIVQAIEEVEGQYGPQFKWYFEVEDLERPISVFSSTIFSLPKGKSEGSKLYRWACAILGREIKEGETIDTADLLRRSCIINVFTKANGYPGVESVAAKRAKKKPKPVQQDDEDEPF